MDKRKSGQGFPRGNRVYCSVPSKQAEHCTPDRWICHSVRARAPWTTSFIQKATASGQLNEHGRGWSRSFMEHMGYVMTKATKTAKELPPNSDELKESYDVFDGCGEQHSS